MTSEADWVARYLDERFGVRRISVAVEDAAPDVAALSPRHPGGRPPAALKRRLDEEAAAATPTPAPSAAAPPLPLPPATTVEQFLVRVWRRAQAGDRQAIDRLTREADPALQAMVDQLSRSSVTRDVRLRQARKELREVIRRFDPAQDRPPDAMQLVRDALHAWLGWLGQP